MASEKEDQSSTPPKVPLRRSSEGTLYWQVYSAVAEMIDTGALGPGSRLPTEEALADQYRVSRSTARRALDELRREGIVERTPGRGTFVRHRRLDTPIPYLHTVEEEIRRLGYTPGVRCLSVDKIAASERDATHLDIPVNTEILRVKRVRSADDQQVYVAESHLNILKFPALTEVEEWTASMYSILEKTTGLETVKATQWFSAVGASSEDASILGIRRGAPLLKLERVVYMTGGVPAALIVAHFLSTVYKPYSESYPPKS